MNGLKRLVAFTLCIMLCFGACSPNATSYAAAKTKISNTKITLTVGQTKKLKMTGTKKKVTWSSDKKKVASVSKKGLVTAKKKGKATVTAKVGKKKYKCKVTVIAKSTQTDVTTEHEQIVEYSYNDNVIVNETKNMTDYELKSAEVGNDVTTYSVSIAKNDITGDLKEGQIVVLPGNESSDYTEIPIKISSVTDKGNGDMEINGTLPKLEEVMSDVKLDYDTQTEMSQFVYDSDIIEEVPNGDLSISKKVTKNETFSVGEDKKYDIAKKFADEHGKLSGSLTIKAPEIHVDVDMDFNLIGKDKVRKANVSISECVVANLSAEYNTEFEKCIGHFELQIGSTPFKITVPLSIKAEIEGKAELNCDIKAEAGFTYKGVGTPKFYKNVTKPSLDKSKLEVKAKLLINPKAIISLFGKYDDVEEKLEWGIPLVIVGVEVGPGVTATIYYTRPTKCADVSIYPYLRVYIDVNEKNSVLGFLLNELGLDPSATLLDEGNDFGINMHFENGIKVDNCTYNEDEETTEEDSSEATTTEDDKQPKTADDIKITGTEGKNAKDVAVISAIIKDQVSKGAEVSTDLDDYHEYQWDENNRLWQIDWPNHFLKGSISFAGLDALAYLDVTSSQLTSLDVSKNKALIWLGCGYNELTSLDVSKNTALEVLGCGGNQLTSLDVSKNTILKYLSCESNQLASLDVSQNTVLEHLNCGGNQLMSLDVSKNTALEILYCGGNQLTSIDVSNNSALKELWYDYDEDDFTVIGCRDDVMR